MFFWSRSAAAGAFFCEKIVFGPGTLPQAPFFVKKTRFWSWNVAAGAFFCYEKNMFLVLERCRRRFFLWKNAFFGPCCQNSLEYWRELPRKYWSESTVHVCVWENKQTKSVWFVCQSVGSTFQWAAWFEFQTDGMAEKAERRLEACSAKKHIYVQLMYVYMYIYNLGG